MLEFSLDGHAHVALCDLSKLMSICESGGQAKLLIADGHVSVDGKLETRKRCKIYAGQIVSVDNIEIKITDLSKI